ncbi:MAG TPA: rhodanese-like domain-containing protein [Burkholderiales bacterium]|nr:rhodanese-like domain-containing protein [Burkholderiales bacterium]
METTEQLLEKARRAGQEQALAYAGALSPASAYSLLQCQKDARLVDVRTRAEWDWVGHVPDSVHIEWNTWPAGTRNPEFERALSEVAPNKDAPLLFLCRSGVRSHAAATFAAQLGYRNALNILEGFEGEKDPDGHRNSVSGWRFRGLPWTQS